MSKDITKRGGTILPSVPVDGNESQHDPIVLDEKTGEAGVKGPVVVISHPGEFRKPNYLMALTTGIYYAIVLCMMYLLVTVELILCCVFMY